MSLLKSLAALAVAWYPELPGTLWYSTSAVLGKGWRTGDLMRLAGGPAPPPPSSALGTLLGDAVADAGNTFSVVMAAVGYVVARRGFGCTDVRTQSAITLSKMVRHTRTCSSAPPDAKKSPAGLKSTPKVAPS